MKREASVPLNCGDQVSLEQAAEALEGELAIGLQRIDLGTVLLLGRGARLEGPGGHWKVSAETAPVPLPLMMCHDPTPVPQVVDVAGGMNGTKLAPLEEFVRLEGHRWATSWTKGRGSVYRLDRYGHRGEALLLPSFCRVEEPELSVYVETNHGRQATSWLCPGLTKLAADVEPQKLSLSDLLHTIQSSHSLQLVLPAAKLGFNDPPSTAQFGRCAARRCPFYIKAFDMGARLELSMVPPLKTRTGDADSVDAQVLKEQLGAQLFSVLNQKALLCIRRSGGPMLDARRITGASLQDICAYLTTDWVSSLIAMPHSWARLDAHAERCCYLESALGPVPGSGSFVTWKAKEQCDVCGLPSVGSEVSREGANLAVCSECAVFVPGSQAFSAKQALAQHTSLPEHKLIGSFDSGLDDTLGSTEPEDPAFSGNYMWPEGTVANDAVVLVVGGMLSLRPPKKGWPVSLETELHKQLQLLIGCRSRSLKILGTAAEAESPNILVNFVLLHPALFFAGKHEAKEAEEVEEVDPIMPLAWYQNLQKELRKMAETQQERKTWTKGEQDTAAPLLLVSDLKRVILPCSLFLMRSHHEFAACEIYERPASKQLFMMHDEVNALLNHVRDRDLKSPAGPAAPFRPDFRPSEKKESARRRSSARERRATVVELLHPDLADLQPDLNRRRMTELVRPTAYEAAELAKLEPREGSKEQRSQEPQNSSTSSWETSQNSQREPARLQTEESQLDALDDDPDGEGTAFVSPAGAREARDGDPPMSETPEAAAVVAVGETPQGAKAVSDEEWQIPMKRVPRQEDVLAEDGEGGDESAGAAEADPDSAPSKTPKDPEGPLGDYEVAEGEGEGSPQAHRCSQAQTEAVVAAVLEFRPSLEQLAVRLRGLVERFSENQTSQVEQVETLLQRWGRWGSDRPGTEGTEPSKACLAILSRNLHSEGSSPSALDMSIQDCNYPVTNMLLRHVPDHLDATLIAVLNGHNPLTGQSLLYAAVKYSNRYTGGVVDELLKRRADINGPGSAPLSISPLSPRASQGERREPPVVSCVRRADLALIKRVLWHQADVNAKAADGKTLLQIAVERGCEDILAVLLSAPGCDVNGTNAYGRTALVSALRTCRPPFMLAQQLLAAQCDASQPDVAGVQPLLHTASIPEPGIHALLLSCRADPDAVATPDTDAQARLLHVAARASNETLLKCLLDATAEPNATESFGRTVLHLAISQNLSKETILAILHARGDPNITTWQSAGGETPLRLAILAQSPAVELLLEAQANPNGRNLAGCSALRAALCGPDSQKTCELLLAWHADPQLQRTLLTSQEQSRISSPSHTVLTMPSVAIQPKGADRTQLPKYMAETWSKAKFRPRQVVRQAEQIEEFDPLCPLTLPPLESLEKKFNRTLNARRKMLPWRTT